MRYDESKGNFVRLVDRSSGEGRRGRRRKKEGRMANKGRERREGEEREGKKEGKGE